MARTLRNFLVGVGYEYDQKGQAQIESGLGAISSKALQLGSVIAGAFGINKLTADFAESVDTLGKFSEVIGVSADDVSALGRALGINGGSLESFMSQLEGIERLRAGLLVGDAGFIAAAGVAGIDTSGLIASQDAVEAYISLADQFQNLSTQQRINAADALGLDDASIRLLSQGSDAVNELVESQRRIRPVTDEMLQLAADFNDSTQDLANNIGGFADNISTLVLPRLNALLEDINGFVDTNRTQINDLIPDALTGGAALAGAGFIFGAPLLPAAAIGAGGTVAYNASEQDVESFTGLELPSFLFQPIGDLIDEATRSLGTQLTDTNTHLPDSGFRIDLPDTSSAGNIVRDLTVGALESIFTNPLLQSVTGGSDSAQQRNTTPIPAINVNLNLDGQVIERKIIEVNERQNDQALNDIRSSVQG